MIWSLSLLADEILSFLFTLIILFLPRVLLEGFPISGIRNLAKMKDTNKTKKYTRFPSVLATSIYRSCSARSRSKHGTKDENSFTFDTTTIHSSTHPLIDQPTNFVKSTVFPIKINACTRRHFNLMRYFSAHKPFLSLD